MRNKAVALAVFLALLVAALLWWPRGGGNGQRNADTDQRAGARIGTASASVRNNATPSRWTNRLSNTGRVGDELLRDDRVVLLGNAVIDVRQPEAPVPEALRARADNGTWIVVAKEALDERFRGELTGAGASIVSFIPNNAMLVRATKEQTLRLKGSPLVASVLAYHPYYKLSPGLLDLAVKGKEPKSDVSLRLGLYGDQRTATLAALRSMRVLVADEERTPFGTTVTVHPPQGRFLDVTRLDGVMVVEVEPPRRAANDLTRPRLGVSADPVTNVNYLNLTGTNVLVGVVDSGGDATHPDLTNHVFGDVPASLTDPNGHGTHVLGTILGNGSQSASVSSNASGSVSNALFSGMAPGAKALMVGIPMDTRPRQSGGFPSSDAYVQETLARSNALIANMSWNYDGDSGYDLHAAGYDWATRDGLPGTMGPQGILYVVSAGNNGGGTQEGSGGIGDTVLSPGTAKNVLTVGAVEALRKITNLVADGLGGSNALFLPETDSSNEVANLSSRGNVGIGLEGGGGRYKPDLVAPGMFVISTKSAQWNQAEYYNPSNQIVDVQFNQTVTPGSLAAYSLVVPPNAVAVIISLQTNEFSLSPFPNLPLYVKVGDNPATNNYDFLGTNRASLPGDLALSPGSEIFYSLGDPTNVPVSFNLVTEVVTTNGNGDAQNVLSNLNVGLGPYYRYESGTSMAAAGVSGMAALLEEFFPNR